MNPATSSRLRLAVRVPIALLAVVFLAVAGFWWLVRRSLPQIEGAAPLPGLSAAAAVERDAAGVPVVRGATRLDVARALGYVHAQDRFFQMDLQRRRPAGELAELMGKAAVPLDTAARVHGFRDLARKSLAALPPAHQALVAAYTAGVNSGLASLRARPFEYLVLRARPQPWLPEDTLLVGYSMAMTLQDTEGRYERILAAIQDVHGRTLLDFLAPLQTPADAAMDGSFAAPAPIPGPDIIDLRRQQRIKSAALRQESALALAASRADPDFVIGSNAFVLSGSRAAGGAGILANDMHLMIGVPNNWYRASLVWPQESGAAGAPHRVTGVTIPGLPLVVAGSNGRVAWGFTNSYADTADIIIVEPAGVDPIFYKNGKDVSEMEERREVIRVKGGNPVETVVRRTIWGAVIGEAERGRSLVLRWVFDDPASLSLNLIKLETAPDAAAALALAPDLGVPTQNLLVADSSGAIGWTTAGHLPRRVGFDGRLPTVWSYGDRRWDGWLPAGDYPRVLNPASGQIWSANQRMAGGADLAKLGDGGYDMANRARQIRDDLTAITAPAAPRDLLAVQLDDRARFLERWQQLLIRELTPDAVAAKSGRAELRRAVERWSGHASIDSAAYHLVRRWREAVATRVLSPIFAPCTEVLESFDFHRVHYETPLWRLVEARPANFLTLDYMSWDDLLLAAADDVVAWGQKQGQPLERLTWGARNTTRIQHPFGRILPSWLTGWLNMPSQPLPGDRDMPRMQSPNFGASERFDVSPGHEEEGIFHMPCGQSGHPLSPFYRAGHDAWAQGKPTPFLPGPAAHTLTLSP